MIYIIILFIILLITFGIIMKMKKVLLFILSFTILSANAVNAKEGFYAGGNVTVNKVEILTTCSGEKSKKTKPTVAVNLGYKFNFNSFTVAPELYFNILSKVYDDSVSDPVLGYGNSKLKEFGGLNVKLGYDINGQLNAFFLVGIAYMDKYKASGIDEGEEFNYNVKMKQPVMNLGLGAEYEVIDNLGVNLAVAYSFGKSKDYITDPDAPEFLCSEKYKNIRVSLGANYYFGF